MFATVKMYQACRNNADCFESFTQFQTCTIAHNFTWFELYEMSNSGVNDKIKQVVQQQKM